MASIEVDPDDNSSRVDDGSQFFRAFGIPLQHRAITRDVYSPVGSSQWCPYSGTLLSWNGTDAVGLASKSKSVFILPYVVPIVTNDIPDTSAADCVWNVRLNVLPDCSVLFYSADHRSGNKILLFEGIEACTLADAHNVVSVTHNLVRFLCSKCVGRVCEKSVHKFVWVLHSSSTWGKFNIVNGNPLAVEISSNRAPYEKATLYGGHLRYSLSPGALIAFPSSTDPKMYVHVYRHLSKGIVFHLLQDKDVVFGTPGSGEPVIFIEDGTSSSIGNFAVSQAGTYLMVNDNIPSNGNFKLPADIRFLKSVNTRREVCLNHYFDGSVSASALHQLLGLPELTGVYIYDETAADMSYGELIVALRSRGTIRGRMSPDLWWAHCIKYPELRSVIYKNKDENQFKGERFKGDDIRRCVEDLRGFASETEVYMLLSRIMKVMSLSVAHMKYVGDPGATPPLILVKLYCTPAVFSTVLSFYMRYLDVISKLDVEYGRRQNAKDRQVGNVSYDQFFNLDADCLGLGAESARLLGEPLLYLTQVWQHCVAAVSSKGLGGTTVFVDRGLFIEQKVFVGQQCKGEKLVAKENVPSGSTIIRSGECVFISPEYLCVNGSSCMVKSDPKGYDLIDVVEPNITMRPPVEVNFVVSEVDRNELSAVLVEFGYRLSDSSASINLTGLGPEIDGELGKFMRPLVISTTPVDDRDVIPPTLIRSILADRGGICTYFELRIVILTYLTLGEENEC